MSEIKYFDVRAVANELRSRRDRRADVESWWKNKKWGPPDFPELPNDDGFAVIARQVATFRYEDASFVIMAERAGLTPVWWEMVDEKFSYGNSFKESLLSPRRWDPAIALGETPIRPPLISAIGSKRKLKYKQLSEIDIKPPSATGDCEPRNLTSYHHEQLARCYPAAIRSDNSRWLLSLGSAKEYYPAYLSLFVAHCVLFEDFESGESGRCLVGFREGSVLPAYRQVLDQFSIPPLIVKLPWWENLSEYFAVDDQWRSGGALPAEWLHENGK